MRFLILVLCIGLLVSLAISYSTNVGNNYSGNPPANNSCVNCHSGIVNSGNGSMTVLNLPQHYVPGQTYSLSLQLQDPGQSRWGFQLTAAKNSTVTERGGTILVTNTSTTRLASLAGNGLQFLNQTSTGNFRNTMNGPVSWPFNWTAPPVGTGTVTFYASGLAANNTGGSSGDFTYVSSFSIPEFIQQNLPPNPFNLTTPTNAAILHNNSTTLIWESNGGENPNDTIFYVLYVSTDESFSIADSISTGTSFTRNRTNLLDHTTYYWKVRAYTSGGLSVWSNQVYHFSIDLYSPIQQSPVLLFPEDHSTRGHPTTQFVWRQAVDPDVDDSIHYFIHFSFRNFVYSYETNYDTTITLQLDTLPPLLATDIIQWWVEATSLLPLSFAFSDTFTLEPYNIVHHSNRYPNSFYVSEAYPNPFNPSTRVDVLLDRSSHVKAVLFDIHGRVVQQYAFGSLGAGTHSLSIGNEDLSTGVYLLRIDTHFGSQLRKLIYMK